MTTSNPANNMNQENALTEEELKKLAVEYAKAILSGDLAPYDGARRIWWEVANPGMDNDEIWELTRGFVNDADDWQDHPDWRGPELEESIRKSARQIVDRWGPS